MPNLKDVAAVVLVAILLASLGYWKIVLPVHLAEKKRRQIQNDYEKKGR